MIQMINELNYGLARSPQSRGNYVECGSGAIEWVQIESAIETHSSSWRLQSKVKQATTYVSSFSPGLPVGVWMGTSVALARNVGRINRTGFAWRRLHNTAYMLLLSSNTLRGLQVSEPCNIPTKNPSRSSQKPPKARVGWLLLESQFHMELYLNYH